MVTRISCFKAVAKKMITLSGLICLRNCAKFDYCWYEAISSLLAVCDEVVCCESDSNDGTVRMLYERAKREPKIKICHYPWPNPVGDVNFYVDWIQYARAHVQSDFFLHLDADEILSDCSYSIVEQFKQGTDPGDAVSLRCQRYNFYKDPWSLIPDGVCLASRVTRIGPKSVFLPSDGAHPLGGPIARMVRDTEICIMHYGFLRRSKAYFEKSKDLHRAFFNSYDDRLVEAEKSGDKWMSEIKGVEWTDRLERFNWSHPKLAIQWLRDRNYQVSDDGKPYHE